jgi:hypothetical protein
MLIIGCDFHTRFQQIAMVDSPTGEIIERRSDHESGEARQFYGAVLRQNLINASYVPTTPLEVGGST